MRKAWIVAFALAAIAGGIYLGVQHIPSDTNYIDASQTVEVAEEDSVYKAGEAFMEKISHEPGVESLGAGVYYKVLRAGNGTVPTGDSKVKVNYEGRLIDGTVFDSSYERGEASSFPVSGVIQGWQLALKAMPVGSEWEIYIPQYYAYGASGSGEKIPPYSALVFKVELLGIE